VSSGSRSEVWRRIEAARPLVAWREAELGAVASVLTGAQEAWCAAWGLSAMASPVTCVPAVEADRQAPWQRLGAGEAGAAWMALPARFEDELALALWGGSGALGPIAQEIGKACRDDFQSRVGSALQVEASAGVATDPVNAGVAWSGWVTVALDAGARLLLDARWVEALLRVHAPQLARRAVAPAAGKSLTPVGTALAGVRLALRARLADCELDLASLQDLRIGDVLAVPHRLDAPLLVRDAQGELVCGGYLARQGQRKALELAACPSGAGQPH